MKRLTPLLFFSSFICQFAFAQVETVFGEGAGDYKELFDNLKTRLLKSEHVQTVKLGGKQRNVFVRWVRDHVHVMKAMKYFSPEISSFWQLYMETQTREGLYFDYYYPIEERVNHRMNLFDKRYWRIFPADSIQMHRLPVEADLEYLMVEGAYYIWQATGDNKYISSYIQQLEKGMHYAMSDPLRWSKKYQLVKRGYTLDTWDFMQLPTTRREYTSQGKDVQKGIFDIDENTPMGIMHGDNSGMYAACNQLSKMYAALGNQPYADAWSKQAEIFRVRTNALCWNGKYYVHFVEDDPMPDYLKIDQKNTLSLSNPYDINRGLPTSEMALSIINTYRGLKENNKMNAFAEWFGIYPAVEPHFADYQPGSYMNGGVNTIVGGELAKAALQNGAEAYGVDILNRMLQLVRKHKGDLPVAYRPDGSVDEGIPDNWGQAAVMSALVEGLAGVVDKEQLFRSVEISPRWVAAGKEDVQVTIAYGPSQKAVSYHFQHSPGKKMMSLSLSGDAENYSIRMLLPKNYGHATAKLNKKAVIAKLEEVGSSRYAVIEKIPKGSHTITLAY
ncbi:MAG: hypothetical protein H7122_06105 [Chitinophagaceae bacterium]|nr:hypothetical protein [Chitinophagaceae bacterium]